VLDPNTWLGARVHNNSHCTCRASPGAFIFS
jgi:hypothetical protein